MRMPSEDELPEGAARDFAAFMFVCYRAAGRPTLAKISRTIRDGDYRTTVSPETIRRMLRADTITARWDIVETVVDALCEIEGVDPDDEWPYLRVTASSREHAKRFWNRALDEPPPRRRDSVDPWDDEPPF
jgi:hypothetical protein